MFSAFSAAVAADGCTSLYIKKSYIVRLLGKSLHTTLRIEPVNWTQDFFPKMKFPKLIWKLFRNQNFQNQYGNLCLEKYSETETKLSETQTETKFSETFNKLEKVSKLRSLETVMSYFVVETWLKRPWQRKMPTDELLAVLLVIFFDSFITAWRQLSDRLMSSWFHTFYGLKMDTR